MAPPFQPPSVHPDRQLRIVTIVAMIPALALLITAGIITASYLPAIGVVPMAFSCLVSAAALGSRDYSPGAGKAMADAMAALSLLGIWVPRLVSFLF